MEGVYTFYELLKAMNRGYRVLDIFEVSCKKERKNSHIIDFFCRFGTMDQKRPKFLLTMFPK